MKTRRWILREIIFKSTTFNFYVLYNILDTRNIFSCPECSKSHNVAFVLHASFPIRNFLLLMKILPVGIDPPAIPPTDWYLCRSVATPPAPLALSRCQGIGADTKHKRTLQADKRRLNHLKFMMLKWLNCDQEEVLLFLPSPHLPPPLPTLTHFPIFPYRHSIQLHSLAFSSAKNCWT